MKAILSTTIIALLSTAMAGCWTYSRHDLETGCKKTSYGLAIAWVSTQDCGLGAAPTSDDPPASPASATTVTTASAAH
jgi:hypothetical protein